MTQPSRAPAVCASPRADETRCGWPASRRDSGRARRGARLGAVAPSRRVLAAVAAGAAATAALIGAVVVAGGSDDDARDEASEDVRTVQPGAPGEGGRELSDDDVADLGAPEHTAVDTAFMQGMLVHHGQALAMTALVDDAHRQRGRAAAGRADHRLPGGRDRAHRAVADRPGRGGPRPRPTTPTHERMPGMATPEQLAGAGARHVARRSMPCSWS